MSMFLLMTLGALASESCTDPFAAVASWELPSAAVRLDRGILETDRRLIGVEVTEATVDGDRIAFVQRGDRELRDLVVWDAAADRFTVLVTSETPSQPKLSPDGRWIAYVNGVTGFSSVWIAPVAGGDPVQLTNIELVRTPGRAPEGFVPSPEHGFTFEGDRLTWSADGAMHAVRIPGGAR